MRPTWSLMLACAAVLAAGCGTKTINSEEAEKKVRAELAEQLGASVKSVDCPDDVEAKKGDKFSCTAKGADGTTAKISMTQTTDSGDFHFDAPLLHTGPAEQQIEQGVSEQVGSEVTVACPDLVEARKGTKLTCKVEDSSGESRDVAVVVTDPQGSIRYEVQ